MCAFLWVYFAQQANATEANTSYYMDKRKKKGRKLVFVNWAVQCSMLSFFSLRINSHNKNYFHHIFEELMHSKLKLLLYFGMHSTWDIIDDAYAFTYYSWLKILNLALVYIPCIWKVILYLLKKHSDRVKLAAGVVATTYLKEKVILFLRELHWDL